MIICDDKYLYPPIAHEAKKALAGMQGLVPGLAIFETWRSPSRQNELYAQGRTAPGSVVTSAKAWDSWHQYGLAFDVAVLSEGQWSWDFDKELVKNTMIQTYGFEPGAAYEYCHFQTTKGLTLHEARAITLSDGILAVWHRLA